MGLGERLSAAWWDTVRGTSYDLAPAATTPCVHGRYKAARSWVLVLFLGSVAFLFWMLALVAETNHGHMTVAVVLRSLSAGGIVAACLIVVLGGLGFEEWTIGDGSVTRRSGGPLGSRSWTEPLSAYRGVVSVRKQRRKGRETEGPYMVQLRHGRDPLRNVPLYSSPKPVGLHDKVRHYGRLLRVPVLMATEDGTLARAPEDIDKSVRELVRTGKLSAAVGSDGPPGSRPRLALRGECLGMRVPYGALGPARVVLMPTAAGVGLTAISLAEGGAISAGSAIASNAAFVVLTGLALWFLGEELLVSPEQVTRRWTWMGARFGARSVRTDQVREVITAEQFSDARLRTVQIVCPNLVLHFGRRLTTAQRRWVRDCIIGVISRAPGTAVQGDAE